MHVHLVFVTRYRSDVFTAELLKVCRESMQKVCSDFGCVLDEFNGETDHVHILVTFPATVEVSRLVNSLKGVSSRMIRKSDPLHVERFLWNGGLWSRSYYAGTVGGTDIETVRKYIMDQDSPT